MASNFDWVRERANCSLGKVFKELELGAQGDIDTINSQRNPDDQIKFSLSKSSGRFAVVRETTSFPLESVDFSLADDEIIVNGSGVNFTATLTLNNKGQCRLKVNGEELEQWQVRRMALEELFFGSPKRKPKQ
jgi:E3 ubiquitin-protein ligase DOA10